MLAAKHTFTAEEGSRFFRLIKWVDSDGNGVDLSSASAVLTVKYRADQEGHLLQWSTSGGQITCDSSGLITIDVDAFSSDFVEGVYELDVTVQGHTIRLLEGRFLVSRRIG